MHLQGAHSHGRGAPRHSEQDGRRTGGATSLTGHQPHGAPARPRPASPCHPGVCTLPAPSPPPLSSPSLRLTFRRTQLRSECLARSPPLLPVLSSVCPWGSSVTQPRGKFTLTRALNNSLLEPQPVATQATANTLFPGPEQNPDPCCHCSHSLMARWPGSPETG